ncbi:MAG: Fe-S cluster assembly protein SufD, partial [Gemmatimonadetes bacterium]|nr:Fe-S cluster assembly protein SufD [Gemmatimonadota bacterium]NIQ57596.1 Fe-S cluster assembly protein SufD [Gemmatimonadota bacterium]NIU77762.1 Fe-S cluster assembly protein SufD [Gammaproteobacteria bacterium]NIX46900.1 Fe-S cluster assembly protein SufD [Gemmatimonadota bacterium]NIY11251.1 Fe-S cluster assembly protein SufD [Gemmatimonadota bacterium]
SHAQPGWLRELRDRAWAAYEELPLPTRKLEEWRYTDVAQLKLDDVRRAAPHADEVPAPARALLDGKEAAAKVLLIGPTVASIEVDPALAERGVVVTDLATAAVEHPELVRKHLGTAVPVDRDKLAALNGALWAGGVFVHVPAGVELDRPIRVARWLSEGGGAVFPRTLIVADRHSHVAYVDEFASPDFDEPALSLGAVEVIAGEGADVQYVAMQQWGEGVRHLSIQRTLAQRDANLDTLVVNLGASVARVDLNARLEGPGARSDMLGLYFARGDQHFDHNTRQDHVSEQANSDLLYKGALYDRAKTVFRGVIRVFPGAQRTDAYQTNRNLLLSEDAEAVSLPNLEIEADDVKCSHGATVGQLDEEELFYLMSRGLDRRAAERLVIFGFFGEVLDRLPLPGVVEELKAAIEAKIR